MAFCKLVLFILCCAPVFAGDNILLIIADDLGVENLSSYNVGSNPATTPNIDALAASGVQFETAWSNPVCSPTRAGIFSGRYGFRTSVGHVVKDGQESYLSTDEFILPEALSVAGYRSALIGKWHVGNEFNGGDDGPNIAGFDHFSGLLSGALEDYYHWQKTTDGVTEVVSEYSTTVNVDDALSWIQQQNENPWMCIVAFNAPHTPFHEPPAELHSVDLTGLDPETDPAPFYKAAIEAMDTEIGRLLSNLGDDLNNTTVIFIGDNGTPGAVVESPYVSNKAKGTVYEGGVRVPMIMSGAQVSRANQTVVGLAQTLDLYATIIELAGLELETIAPVDTVIDSVSLVPYLNTVGVGALRNYLYTEIFDTSTGEDKAAIRNFNCKLVRTETAYEFYELTTDPYEESNLLKVGLTETQSRMFRRLKTYMDNL